MQTAPPENYTVDEYLADKAEFEQTILRPAKVLPHPAGQSEITS